DSVKPFFSRAGLPWGVGSYHRTTWALNQSAVGVANAQKLPQRYSQKAVLVNNVAPEEYVVQNRRRVGGPLYGRPSNNWKGGWRNCCGTGQGWRRKAGLCRRRKCGGRVECGRPCHVRTAEIGC